jgi:hypothetical protein
MSFSNLETILAATLDPLQSKNATDALKAASLQPGFAIALLQTTGNAGAPLQTRLAASLKFKNYIREHWVCFIFFYFSISFISIMFSKYSHTHIHSLFFVFSLIMYRKIQDHKL